MLHNLFCPAVLFVAVLLTGVQTSGMIICTPVPVNADVQTAFSHDSCRNGFLCLSQKKRFLPVIIGRIISNRTEEL